MKTYSKIINLSMVLLSTCFIGTSYASICFIADTQNCQGGEFGGSGSTPEWNPDPDNRCKNEGYSKVNCNSVEIPTNKCPYDDGYAEKCECKPALVTCSSPNIGIGEACEGKYEACCNNECPVGYAVANEACREASVLKTACGNTCYKCCDNTCRAGSLVPPIETDGNRNKIVSTTKCGNPCWQSFNDNCLTGHVKDKIAGKCYDTTYTAYGSPCYKEKSCCRPKGDVWGCMNGQTMTCSDECSGSRTCCRPSCEFLWEISRTESAFNSGWSPDYNCHGYVNVTASNYYRCLSTENNYDYETRQEQSIRCW